MGEYRATQGSYGATSDASATIDAMTESSTTCSRILVAWSNVARSTEFCPGRQTHFIPQFIDCYHLTPYISMERLPRTTHERCKIGQGPQDQSCPPHFCFLNSINGFPASITSFGFTSNFSTFMPTMSASALTLISSFIASRITTIWSSFSSLPSST